MRGPGDLNVCDGIQSVPTLYISQNDASPLENLSGVCFAVKTLPGAIWFEIYIYLCICRGLG